MNIVKDIGTRRSTKDIAAKLLITERIGKTRLTNVFAKSGLRNGYQHKLPQDKELLRGDSIN